MASIRLLLVDDEPIIHEVFQELLQGRDYELDHAYTIARAMEMLQHTPYDLILLDVMLPDGSGEKALTEITTLAPEIPVIMITAYGTVDSAVYCMKMGAFDYLTKPFDNDQVLRVIEKALRHRMVLIENQRLRNNLELAQQFENIIGKSPRMQQIYDMIHRVARSRSTILIQGESGTGKELVARAIHMISPRANRPFVIVTCSNIPAELLESELFGHEKGAFTGAVEAKRGLLEIADGGTVFLDEIGTMPMPLQSKLLRVLQEREFKRVGGLVTHRVDIRFIAATNVKLEDLVRQGKFREDLFYRINVITIDIPPLRERREDIPLLVRHFLRKYGSENDKPDLDITDRALQALVEYDWPGNVRELEHTIERAAVLAEGSLIDIELLPESIREAGIVRARNVERAPVGFREKVENYKRALILEALREAGGVQRRAAEILRLKPTTLHEMMKRYNIKNPESS